ncbi:MAG: hypothetical protein J6A01_02995 [Proteobacteria bacterium]|nr:hypothetical protein [Pseudomonadota bacterium]
MIIDRHSIFLACLLCIAGCSGRTPENTQPREVDTVDDKPVIEMPEMPEKTGVFGVVNGTMSPIEAGEPDRLMQTNAERGFGFAVPLGHRVSGKVSSFRIHAPQLDVSHLSMTRYQGVAVISGGLNSPVDNTNTAWLPAETIPAQLKVYDAQEGLAEVIPEQKLAPGFYVIHDNSMFRGRQSSDVSAFYPIQVPKGGSLPWFADSDQCFEAAQELVEMKMLLGTVGDADKASLTTCAQMQRLALKAAVAAANEVLAQNIQLRLYYLARLLDPADREAHLYVREQMSPTGDGLKHALWLLEKEINLAQLIELHMLGDKPFPAGTVQSILDHYRSLDKFKKQFSEYGSEPDHHEPLGGLLWVLYARLENTEPMIIETLFDAILEGIPWQQWLVQRLGGIEYLELQQIADKDKTAANRLEILDESIPGAFVMLSSRMHLKSHPSKVTLGPYRFSGIPEDEISAWRATIQGKTKEIQACLDPKVHADAGFLVLKQSLNATVFEKDAMGVLYDPIADTRTRQTLSPAEIQCILKAFTKLPTLPSLENDQSVQVGMTFLER